MTRRTKAWEWWPLLLGPLGMAVAYAIDRSGPPAWWSRATLEPIAIALASTALLGAVVHTIVARRAVLLFHCVIALIILMREFHWDWTTKAVYVALGAVIVVAVALRRVVGPYLRAYPRAHIWIVATGATYVLSQFIARRGFRGIMPNEVEVYTLMEEGIEDLAHAMLVVTVLMGPWRPRKGTDDVGR